MSTTATPTRVRLRGLNADEFIHPDDRKALEAVKKARGLDFVFRKFNEIGFERYLYLQHVADSVRVNERQCPKIYHLFREACDILDVPEPQLYLKQTPVANAYTFGTERPFVVLFSGMVDLLTEEELLAVMGHELGHVKCGHVLYHMIGQFLSQALAIIGAMTLGVGSILGAGLMVSLYNWVRKAELTADRAGLLAVQSPDVAVTVEMKLAGGSRYIWEQMDKDEFLRQAEHYKSLDEDELNKFYKMLQIVQRTHPFPTVRAREIVKWVESGDYQSVLGRTAAGEAATDPRPTCPACGTRISPTAAFCHRCGTHVGGVGAASTTPATCSACGATLRAGFAFCPQCGKKAGGG